MLDFEPQNEPNDPPQPQSPRPSSPRASPVEAPPTAEAPPTPACTAEAQHDVQYFRAEMAAETERLTSLCDHCEAKVEDEAIPEESEFTRAPPVSVSPKTPPSRETCLRSERPHADGSGPGQAADEGAL